MTNLRNEIQLMQLYLTGYQFSEAELDFMSNRELRDLHSELYVSYKEAIEDSIEMYIDLNY